MVRAAWHCWSASGLRSASNHKSFSPLGNTLISRGFGSSGLRYITDSTTSSQAPAGAAAIRTALTASHHENRGWKIEDRGLKIENPLFDFVNPQAFVPRRGLSLAGSRARKRILAPLSSLLVLPSVMLLPLA